MRSSSSSPPARRIIKQGRRYGLDPRSARLGEGDGRHPADQLLVYAVNEGACRLYERLGFELEGRLRRAALYEGAYIDILVMGRLI